MKSPLGRFMRVDKREYWEDEAREFTPWLVKEENLRLLGEAIGIPLEPVGTERFVGPFKADLLAREAGTDGYMLIENQLERTNHDHLGKLVTYAAGLNAKAVVWVAREITEEHRKALEWLNEATREGYGFFAVELELWRIGESPPAPRFNVVVQPNEWARAQQREAEEPSEAKALQYEFWAALVEFARGKTSLNLRKARPQHWYSFSVGRAGFGHFPHDEYAGARSRL